MQKFCKVGANLRYFKKREGRGGAADRSGMLKISLVTFKGDEIDIRVGKCPPVPLNTPRVCVL